MEELVTEFTKIVEEEINAYSLLLDTLIKQQLAMLEGNSKFISRSNVKVEEMMNKTKELGRNRRGDSLNLCQNLEKNENIKFNDIIPFIEKKYADRLKEFKNILEILSHKVQITNDRNQYVLKNSIEFIDKCLSMITSEHGVK